MIELKDLYKTFSPELRPMRGVDLTVEKGTNMVVLGRSGTGKSGSFCVFSRTATMS